MILISVILSCIKPIPRHYYILPLNYCKQFLQCCFFKGGGMSHLTCRYQLERKYAYVVANPNKAPT